MLATEFSTLLMARNVLHGYARKYNDLSVFNLVLDVDGILADIAFDILSEQENPLQLFADE